MCKSAVVYLFSEVILKCIFSAFILYSHILKYREIKISPITILVLGDILINDCE